MAHSSLRDFADRLAGKAEISADDVRHLQREILPDGISAREDIETLIGLDERVHRADPAWRDWLVLSIVDFAVWGERPTGHVDKETAHWLATLLLRRGASSITARRIADETIREAETSGTILRSITADEEPMAVPLAA
jgi:hypothetical protein